MITKYCPPTKCRKLHRQKPLRSCSAAALLLTSVLSLQAEETKQLEEIGFQPLEIHTFKAGSSRLVVKDLNNDGLDDIVFANNYLSRLEILMRKAGLENLGDLPALEECFEDKGIIVDQGIRELRVHDLNNDKLEDLITFGTTLGLQIRYQNTDGSFAEPEEIFLKNLSNVTAIRIGDLNEDGRKDIIVCRRETAELLWNAKTAPFQKKKEITFSENSCYHCEISDINNDSINDIVFFFTSSSSPIAVRYGKGDGNLGIEHPIKLPSGQFRLLLGKDSGHPKLAMVLQSRLAFRIYNFEEKPRTELMESQETTPLRIGLEGTEGKNEPAWIVGEFNGDKFEDLLIAAPELSRMHLYAGTKTGLEPEPKPIDSLSQIDRISQFANGDILVISRKEQIAAIHTEKNLSRFPQTLSAPGEVLAGCANESSKYCWLVCKDDDKNIQLVRTKPNDEEQSVHKIDIRNDPSDIMTFELPGDKTGILLFMPYDTPKMYLYAESKLEELSSDTFRAIAQQLKRGNIRLVKPGHGEELVVSQGAVARKFQWKNDHYEIVRQFNPENSKGELITSCNYTLCDKSEGIMFFDRNSSDLIYFSDSESDWGKIHLANANQNISSVVQLKNKKQDILILIDPNGINEVLGSGTQLEAVASAEYETDAEEPSLTYAMNIKLGAPPEPMIALVDTANRSIEIVKEQNGELIRTLCFEVFQVTDFADSSSTRTVEPHDLDTGDLNGDGIGDLVALCQDKLLIYLGE